ncbi:SGT1-domain-containing protein [Auricularia subglabra TFB-10046 SS5]|nr:SGT1-domain-containing protein [Auricularia subglabra TFB-10046 SS5]
MDIFNRAPSVAEDTVAYELYPSSPGTAKDKAAVAALATVIRGWLDAQLPEHIWHRDAFELKVVQSPDISGYWMLEGRMRVGDCVDDEWLVVWLLREASKIWDLVVSVFDTDGEFLLIEAADALPSWVSPSNAENRVWIYKGQLHLVPLSHISPPSSKTRRSRYFRTRDSDDEGGDEESSEYLAVQDALRLVTDPNVNTVPDRKIQQAAFRRIENYPALARQHVHTARARLPVDIARALSAKPSLVQKAVEAFYTRDGLQLRAANRMLRFPPEPSVLSTVRMTRTAYAQLVGQVFFPPKPFGRWSEPQGSPEWRWRDLGMKIACGFEMLYQESKGRSELKGDGVSNTPESDARLDALRRNADYQKYITNLSAAGYFQHEAQGSRVWQERESRAAHVFIESLRDDDATRPSFAAQVNGALASVDPTRYAAATAPDAREDADSWLNVDETELDAIIGERASGTETAKRQDSDVMHVDSDPTAEEQTHPSVEKTADRLQRLARKVEKFVDSKGDVQGALFEDEQQDSDDGSGNDSDLRFSDQSSNSDSDEEDPDDSQAAAQARREAMDRLVPPLEAGEYGKMPAEYYSNSQRTAAPVPDPEAPEQPQTQQEPREGSDVDILDMSAAVERTFEKPPRAPLLPRDRYDGVDSDDETDDEEVQEGAALADAENAGEYEDDEEDRPQLVGDVEIDMADEQEEFLQFAREALGISDDMWRSIVEERVGKGAFVPAGELTSVRNLPQSEVRSVENLPNSSTSAGYAAGHAAVPAGSPAKPAPEREGRRLDTFESVMDAMDQELARAREAKQAAGATANGGTAAPTPNQASAESGVSKDKGKGRAVVESEDIEAAMGAELEAALNVGDADGGEDDDALEPGDYHMMRNFLESFKAQGGLAGPVSSLAGRLEPGWRLPRDEQ